MGLWNWGVNKVKKAVSYVKHKVKKFTNYVTGGDNRANDAQYRREQQQADRDYERQKRQDRDDDRRIQQQEDREEQQQRQQEAQRQANLDLQKKAELQSAQKKQQELSISQDPAGPTPGVHQLRPPDDGTTSGASKQVYYDADGNLVAGYGKDGYDRFGYDRNGNHRNLKGNRDELGQFDPNTSIDKATYVGNQYDQGTTDFLIETLGFNPTVAGVIGTIAGGVGAVVGGVEDAAEALGLDNENTSWGGDYQFQPQNNRRRPPSSPYPQEHGAYLQEITEDTLEREAVQQDRGYNDDYFSQPYQQAKDNGLPEYNVQRIIEQDIQTSIKSQIARYSSPAVVQSLFQGRKTQNYLPSAFRDRGSTGGL